MYWNARFLFDETMREVLRGAKYDKLTGRAIDFRKILTDLVQRVLEFIFSRLDIRLPDWTDYNTSLFLYIFIGIAAIILLAVVAAVIIIISKRRAKKEISHDLSDIFEEIERKQYTVAELFALSDGCAAESNYREAVRYRFIAILLSLNERRVIRIGRSKTNAQLVNELSFSAPALSDIFRETVHQYQLSWFGYKETGIERYGSYAKNAEALIEG